METRKICTYIPNYHFRPADFFELTLPVTGLSLILLILLCFGVKAEHIQVRFAGDIRIADKRHLAVYIALFLLCLLCVFQLLPFPALLLVVLATITVTDRSLLRKVDYGLLATFLCFFIFAGNMEHIPAVRRFTESFIQNREQLAAILLSQVISNVPAAVLLSGFTDKAGALLLGVNIGGLGTLVASLASLISYKLYAKSDGARPGRYLAAFSAVNAGVLLVLLLVFQ